MTDENKIDLGSIQIHKKVIADIVETAIKDIDGVNLISGDLTSSVMEMFGRKTRPGVSVIVDREGQVSIEVKVVATYGIKIPEVARHAQDAIRDAVGKTVDINLKEVNINIQGIERGNQ